MIKQSHSLLSMVQPENDLDLRKRHLKLNQYYYTLLFGSASEHAAMEKARSELKKMESDWIAHDKQQCLKKYNCNETIKDIATVERALKEHAVVNHPLFDYLCYESDLNYLKMFILSESILNFDFFDYLTLALIGASDTAKAEISANLWDEAGRGDVKKFHTVLFGNLINDLGLNYQRAAVLQNLSWEALAGINLFSYCSSYSYNKMMYFGLMAATEMLDPPHYRKLIQGMGRIFKEHKIDQSYYLEHESIDVEHADGWLRKVILPELAFHPQKTREFWLGFYLRLDSAKRYYDSLLHLCTIKQAA